MSTIRIKNLPPATSRVAEFDTFDFVVDASAPDATLKLSGKELKQAVTGGAEPTTATESEWYNLQTRKDASGYLYTVVENFAILTFKNPTQYRFVLLKFRKQHTQGRRWSMPMMSYELFNQGYSASMPPCAIAETNAWWQVTGNPTPWFAGSGAKLEQVVSLAVRTHPNGKWYWSNVRNKRMRVGVALYKNTGVGKIGWHRVSNISYVELYKRNAESGYVINIRE